MTTPRAPGHRLALARWACLVLFAVLVVPLMGAPARSRSAAIHPAASGPAHMFWARANVGWEMRIGRQVLERAAADMGGVWHDAGQHRRVEHLGRRLLAVSRQRYPTHSFVLTDSPAINAGALIGGYVLVTRGLLAVSNDQELAGCLAHEIAHLELAHGRQQLEREIREQRLLEHSAARDDDALDREVAAFALTLLQARRSQQEESEADLRGQELLRAAGLDPLGQISSLWKVAAGPVLTTANNPDKPPPAIDAPGATHYVYVVPRRLSGEAPFAARPRMHRLTADHPPIGARIQALADRLRATGRYVPDGGPYMPEDDPDPAVIDPGLVSAEARAVSGPQAPGVLLCFPWTAVAPSDVAGGKPAPRASWRIPDRRPRQGGGPGLIRSLVGAVSDESDAAR